MEVACETVYNIVSNILELTVHSQLSSGFTRPFDCLSLSVPIVCWTIKLVDCNG